MYADIWMGDRRRAYDCRVQLAILHHALHPVIARAAHLLRGALRCLRAAIGHRNDSCFVAMLESLKVRLGNRTGSHQSEAQLFPLTLSYGVDMRRHGWHPKCS